MRDAIDEHIDGWLRELPELDPVVEAIIGRFGILNGRLNRRRRLGPRAGVLDAWEYKTLLALRRRGVPGRAMPKELAAELGLSPAAVTKRLTALEARGLVRRTHSIEDRRRVHVTLTSKGLRRWQRAMEVERERETAFFQVLSPDEKVQLADLLRKLVLAGEGHPPPRRRPA